MSLRAKRGNPINSRNDTFYEKGPGTFFPFLYMIDLFGDEFAAVTEHSGFSLVVNVQELYFDSLPDLHIL